MIPTAPQRLAVGPLRVSRREVLRNLGYPRARRPRPQVEQTLAALWDEAHALLQPRGVYRVVTREQAQPTQLPRLAELVGLGLATVGPALEQRVQLHTDAGEMLEALLLDAFGSAAAEAMADEVNRALCELAQAEGYQLPPRVSPGYGRWPITAQPALLGLLEAESVQVRLTEGLMMVPRKTVSFAVRFERGLGQSRLARRRCARCDLVSCAFREEEPDASIAGDAAAHR